MFDSQKLKLAGWFQNASKFLYDRSETKHKNLSVNLPKNFVDLFKSSVGQEYSFDDENDSYEDVAYAKIAHFVNSMTAIIDSVQTPELQWYRSSRSGKEELITDHEIMAVVDKPNFYQDYSEFISYTAGYWKLRGEIVWIMFKERDMVNMFCLSPVDVTVYGDKLKRIGKFGYTVDHNEVFFPPEQIIFRRDFNPSTSAENRLRGHGIKHLEIPLDLIYFMSKANKNIFKNGIRPSDIVFETDQPLSETDYNIMYNNIKKEFKGYDNFHNLLFLYNGLKTKPLSWSLKDMEFKELMKMSKEEISMGVPPIYSSSWDQAHYNNAETQKEVFFERVIEPVMSHISWAYDQAAKMLGYTDIYSKYNFKHIDVYKKRNLKLIDDTKKIWDMVVPFNVAKNMTGLDVPDVPGGDIAYVPLNLIPVDVDRDIVQRPQEPAEEPLEEPKEESKLITGKKQPQLSFDPNGYLGKINNLDQKINDMIWKQFARETEQREKRFIPVIERLVDKQAKETMAKYDKLKGSLDKIAEKTYDLKMSYNYTYDPETTFKDIKKDISKFVDIIFDMDAYEKEFAIQGKPFINDAVEYGFNKVKNDLRTDFEEPIKRIDETVKRRTEQFFAKETNETTRDLLNKRIFDGIDQGLTITEIRDSIADAFGVRKGRANTIARTEVLSSYSVAQDMARQEAEKITGRETERVWLSARDPFVRESHQIDGQKAGKDGVYDLKSGMRARYPRDEMLPADDVINCRCDERIRFKR